MTFNLLKILCYFLEKKKNISLKNICFGHFCSLLLFTCKRTSTIILQSFILNGYFLVLRKWTNKNLNCFKFVYSWKWVEFYLYSVFKLRCKFKNTQKNYNIVFHYIRQILLWINFLFNLSRTNFVFSNTPSFKKSRLIAC